MALVQGDARVSLAQDGSVWSTDAAPSGDVALEVTATGDYTLRSPGAVAHGTHPGARGGALLPTDAVAARWDSGQRLDGVVRVTNRGAQRQVITLDAWTSHHAWAVAFDEGSLTLEPGVVASVPMHVECPRPGVGGDARGPGRPRDHARRGRTVRVDHGDADR
ncbi:MAG: hypothetical protein R3C32_13925 [Chloroflexota bacterium]